MIFIILVSCIIILLIIVIHCHIIITQISDHIFNMAMYVGIVIGVPAFFTIRFTINQFINRTQVVRGGAIKATIIISPFPKLWLLF